MGVKKSFYPIPTNTPYSGPGRLFMMCVPDDQMWKTAVREAVRQLSKGRYWDRETGVITDAQETGWEIYNSMIDCTEILSKLDAIAVAIGKVALSNDIHVSCCDQLTPPNPPDPLPDPLPDPGGDPADIPPAYPDPPAYEAELCRMANALHWIMARWLSFLASLDQGITQVAILISLALAIFPEPISSAIGAAAIAAIVSVVAAIEGAFDEISLWADALLVEWNAAQQEFVCLVYNAVVNQLDIYNEVITYLETKEASIPETLPGSLAVRWIFGWLAAFMLWWQEEVFEFYGVLESHPNPVPCVCTPPALIEDAADIDQLAKWTIDRVGFITWCPDVLLNCYDLNARDISSAYFRLNQNNFVSDWGNVAGDYENVSLSLRYARCEGSAGTFLISMKNAATNALQAVHSVDTSTLTTGVDTLINLNVPFDVRFDDTGGVFIMEIGVSTGTPRLRMSIRDIEITGDPK